MSDGAAFDDDGDLIAVAVDEPVEWHSATTNQIGRQRRQPIVVIFGPSVLDRYITAFEKSLVG